MDSFETLGLAAELVEALAGEGFEAPTPIQASAIPVLRRGGSVVLEAGPGAGTLLTYGAALLDRVEGGERQSVLVACPTDEDADALARSLARFAEVRGSSVAALGGHWSTPTSAAVLFGSVDRLVDLLRLSELELENVQALVVERCDVIVDRGALAGVTLLAEALPGVQKVFLGLPVPDEVEALARRTSDKPVHIPPRSVEESQERTAPRGSLQYRIVAGQRIEHLLQIVHERVERAGREHVAVHFRTEDQAADVGDEIAMHGFQVGAVGDVDAVVWLCPPGSPPVERREDPLTVVGFEPPVSTAELVAAHAEHPDSIVLVEARELPHLRALAARSGYELRALPTRPSERRQRDLLTLEQRLGARLAQPGLAPYVLLAERLGRSHDPVEVAAAALALALEAPAAPVAPLDGAPVTAAAPSQVTWAKLFLSIGERDGVGPGDLLGAVTGETGISGSQVGKIDIHDSYTLLEIQTAQAEKVVRALNGTTIRGRSVRVDFDRGQKKSKPRGGPPRSGGRGRGPARGPGGRAPRPGPES